LVARRGAAQGDKTALPEGKHSIKPFHIIGNIYYVGLDGNTSFLITSPQGHMLLDMTYQAGVPYIRKNIEELGFNVKDIKYHLDNRRGGKGQEVQCNLCMQRGDFRHRSKHWGSPAQQSQVPRHC